VKFPEERQHEGGAGSAMATLFVAHADARLGPVASALRDRGYGVIELLPGEVPGRLDQHPAALIIDASQHEAIGTIQAVRGTPQGAAVEIFVIGLPDAETSDPARALGTAFFEPDVEPASVVSAIDELLRGRSIEPGPGPGPEADELPLSPSAEVLANMVPVMHSLHGSSLPPHPGSSQPPDSVGDPSPWSRGPLAGPTALSPDLERLLREAERRMMAEPVGAADVPTPEEEVNAILPAEVLAALDEPLDAAGPLPREEPEDEPPVLSAALTGQHTSATRVAGVARELSSAGRHETASGVLDDGKQVTTGSRQLTTGAHALQDEQQNDDDGELDDDLDDDAKLTPVPPTPHSGPEAAPEAGPSEARTTPPRRERVTSAPPPPTIARPDWQPSPLAAPRPVRLEDATPTPPPAALVASARPSSGAPALPEVLTEKFDGMRVIARCIAARATLSLCFEEQGVLRRAILKDGDFVTSASSAPDESLVGYLVARGDLAREVGVRLGTRLPPFGRHAAAALIAHGHLGQDQLWPMLRAHAEWLLGKMALTRSGVCTVEPEPPGRLRAEPSVFGGAAGAEIMVEVTLRVLQPEEAVQRLGGARSRLADGAHRALLPECALAEGELEVAEELAGQTVGEVLRRTGEDFAPMLAALAELGVVEVLATVGQPEQSDSAAPDLLDAEAVRARVKARMALVLEGDYFELLGVSSQATTYEIRRAYLEARRAYEPSRLLTAATADLADDVRTIVEVIEEAWEALRDPARRERYRAALGARPPD
jgi:hypothetical protein